MDSYTNHSWDFVQKEKAADMIHVLQFPYNGEPPRVSFRNMRFRRSFT